MEPVADERAANLVGVRIAGRYDLIRKIGEGGMGAVYEAEDLEKRRVAVKILGLIAESADEQHVRFFRECATLAKLKHPNVVALLDTGTDLEIGAPYLAMELLTGRDVAAVLEQFGALEPDVAVRIALAAAAGIASAHGAGVIHRDVKPANIFLAHGDAGEIRVKVCDFGIAKQSAQSVNVTRTGRALGSPLYMAPEQAKNAKHVDVRADVWSLGVTLYEMLSGRTPVPADRAVGKILVAICTEDAPHLQSVAPWIDPRLAAAVHGALHRDPDARWSSISAFTAALEAVLPELGGRTLGRDRLRGVANETRAKVAPRAVLPDVATTSSRRPPAEDDPFVGRSLGGKYKVERRIGKGGMGAVYEAVAANGERFATKVILNESTVKSAEAKKRFVREARTAAAITSPNVVHLIEAETDLETGTPFLVLELLRGEDLAQVVARLGALEPRTVARLGLQACAGVGAAHERGIVHRDIKPANLFLAEDEQRRIVLKVCDFGIAKSAANEAMDASGASLTQTGGVLGSPAYMSPEQAKNAKHVGVRSDVWSLSLTLWEALTGERPWAHATTLGELIVAICTENLPRVVDRAPWVPEALGAAIDRGLRRDPEKRWPDIASLARALEPFAGTAEPLAQEAIEARPSVESGKRPARTADRRPELFASTVEAASGSDFSGLRAQPKSAKPRAWFLVAGVIAVFGIALTARAFWPGATPAPLRDAVPPSASPAAAAAPSQSSSLPVVEPGVTAAPGASPPSAAPEAAAARPSAAAPAAAKRPTDAHPAAAPSAEPHRPPPEPSTPRLQNSW